MDQISPPIRILLVVAVLFGAVYVVALRPKPAEDSAPTPTPVTDTSGTAQDGAAGNTSTDLGAAVEAAEGAAKTSGARNGAIESESGTSAPSTSAATSGEAAKSAAGTSSEPADPAIAELPAWLQDSLGEKVVAVLFWNADASDDRRTHAALKQAYTAGGKVVTRSVPLDKVSAYGAIARGVDVSQSPTLMVIDRDKQATALVGYANLEAINQAIIDGVLATDNPAKEVPVVKQMQEACQGFKTSSEISAGDLTPNASYRRDLDQVGTALAATLAQAPGAKKGPYARQAGLLRSYVKSEQGIVRSLRGIASGGGMLNGKAVNKAQAGNNALEARATLQLNAIGVTGCN